MKAWAIKSYGDNSKVQLMDLPEPKVGDDEILIQMKAASLNPVDLKIRDGKLKAIVSYSFPLILGHDCAGIVVKIGSNVKRFRIGDEVYTRPEIGTLAELVVAKETAVAKKPKNITFEEAASLPLVALTSWQALFQQAKLKSGDKIFIPAGSGGVGSFAIQLAKHFGAYVITNTSTKNIEFAKSLGADEVIDYKKEDFSKMISEIDIVFDTQGGETQKKAFEIIKSGGSLVSIVGPPTPQFVRDANLGHVLLFGASILSFGVFIRSFLKGVHYKFFFMRPDGLILDKITELIEAESIRPVIDRTFPFERAHEALEYLEKGHARGKVVVSL